jgi:hypothetical protein
MKNKIIRIEWLYKPDDVPRLMTVDESTIFDEELIRAIESCSQNKVANVYFYEPQPQYLILSLTNLLKNGTSIPAIILTLTPTLIENDCSANAVLKIFGLCPENELVYDIVRSTFEGYWEEQDYSLFFTEFAINQEGKQISILELLFNILITYQVQITESDTPQFHAYKLFREN